MRRRKLGEHDPLDALDAEIERTSATLRRDEAEQNPGLAIEWAIDAVLRDIPPPPADLAARVLGPVRRECEARAANAEPTSSGRSAAAQRALCLWPAVALAALAIVITPTLAPSGRDDDPRAAVAAVRFAPRCGIDSDGPAPAGGARSGRLEGRRLVVAATWRRTERVRFERVLDRFAQMTGVRVTYAYETRNIADTLNARLERGCPPDVALLPQPGLLDEFARRGAIKPIDGATRTLTERYYPPMWRRLATRRGRQYGVWFKAANKSTFWYSRRAFARAGVTPPATWDGWLKVAPRLRASGIAPLAVAGADGWPLTDWFENVYLRTAGAAGYDALASGDRPWTDKSVRIALERLAEILGRSPWLAGGTRGARRTGFDTTVGQVFGASPTAAMLFEGDFVANLIGGLTPAGVSRDAGTFRFPHIGSRDSAVVVGGDVAVMFKDNPAARALLRFLATPEAAEPWARAGGFISPNRRLDTGVYPDPTMRRLAQALVGADTIRFDLSDLQPPAFGASAGHGMWSILQDYLADGGRDVESTMRRLQDAARAARSCEQALGRC